MQVVVVVVVVVVFVASVILQLGACWESKIVACWETLASLES